MFADMHHCPLCREFYQDGCSYTTIDGGLTQGDAETFLRGSDEAKRFPVNQDESMSHWAERYGEALYKAIREYKTINKAMYDIKHGK